ncbi:hypothetical protein T02_13493 [Trichinella nativa]|uniref:Uncharacterized protein n=1 Tax=Trichinella nativa TaxID=6335 RepID=A0A0V1LI94_9BILA|nr:hypothetical protein T06_3330 [Trichinella sp. T6]KRZ59211.1 hypothetical protein T02_13493 [Trichinella nativa]
MQTNVCQLKTRLNSVSVLRFLSYLKKYAIRYRVDQEFFWKQPGRFQDAVSDKEKPGTNFI